jgi:ATP-dependent phosphoenolpyruvate carboxykinase
MNNISKTRSVKTKTQNFESSFGQNFMEQHSIALKKILQKLMEICYPHLKKV